LSDANIGLTNSGDPTIASAYFPPYLALRFYTVVVRVAQTTQHQYKKPVHKTEEYASQPEKGFSLHVATVLIVEFFFLPLFGAT